MSLSPFVQVAHADRWVRPATTSYPSSDGVFRLTVYPKADVGGKPCLGRLEKRSWLGFLHSTIWERQLVNDVAPVTALVTRNGKYVVTFDNWHAMGTEPNTVVIYGPDGKLIRQIGLKDFLSADEIRGLPRSVSSIWWGRGHYLAEGEEIVILRVTEPGSNLSETNHQFREIQIRLANGEVIRVG